MLFSRHLFSCNFNTAATLPAFKGSIIRGMLGWALRSHLFSKSNRLRLSFFGAIKITDVPQQTPKV
ncbi:hypothetical protein DGI_3312 [Megalodesulfovibrio gigas DSM 1382 = ATCC 19364]|uniref:Uncharacterized protein n=1 Tax=Megalodesulfovibrio gigas (strain ATCC 19364 / DSM 1382 / NCIMB 9332 / VKM B-1759) TaxID=1121448 RepID=T2GFE0_MEGG1|nr:hypothetical protein DGI_3312 [Megalodesulfovibrio gigas DSM 1382 = ATCC 19364]